VTTRPIIEIDISDITKYLNAIGDPSLGREAVKTGMRAGGEDLRGKMTQNLSGRILNVQTGHYRRNIYVSQPKNEGDAIVLEYGARGVPYAPIHEFGGVIRAVNKPYLVFKPRGVDHFVSVRQVTIPERRPLRDAGERAVPSFQQQIALYAIKALREAGKLA
jgi:phage gpG-like protein